MHPALRDVTEADLPIFFEHQSTPAGSYVAVHNFGSIRVLEKCGFRQAGGAEAGRDGVAEYLFQLGA